MKFANIFARRSEDAYSGSRQIRFSGGVAGGKPVLLRVNYEEGHGFGAMRKQKENLYADFVSFFFWQFGMPGFQPNHP